MRAQMQYNHFYEHDTLITVAKNDRHEKFYAHRYKAGAESFEQFALNLISIKESSIFLIETLKYLIFCCETV